MSASADRLRRAVPRIALDQNEAAEALGLSVDSFERHVKPHVECVYAGAKRLYPVSALEGWLSRESVLEGRSLRLAEPAGGRR